MTWSFTYGQWVPAHKEDQMKVQIVENAEIKKENDVGNVTAAAKMEATIVRSISGTSDKPSKAHDLIKKFKEVFGL